MGFQNMKKALVISVIFIASCSTLSHKGKFVKFLKINPKDLTSGSADSKMSANGCVFINTIKKDNLVLESDHLVSLKNQTADLEGNALLMPNEKSLGIERIPTEGRVYRCPETLQKSLEQIFL